MIYNVDNEFDEMVQAFLTENGVRFEVIETPFLMRVQTGLWQAIYDRCDEFPEDVQGTVYGELYAKVPELAKAIDRKDMEDISYGRDEKPLRVAAKFEGAFYGEIIEKELEKLRTL